MRHLEPVPGPLHQYLSYLNAGLSLLLGLYAIGFRGRNGVHDGFWMLCLLPGRKHLYTPLRLCPRRLTC